MNNEILVVFVVLIFLTGLILGLRYALIDDDLPMKKHS